MIISYVVKALDSSLRVEMSKLKIKVVKGPITGPYCSLEECIDYQNQPVFNIRLANGMFISSESDFIHDKNEENLEIEIIEAE